MKTITAWDIEVAIDAELCRQDPSGGLGDARFSGCDGLGNIYSGYVDNAALAAAILAAIEAKTNGQTAVDASYGLAEDRMG